MANGRRDINPRRNEAFQNPTDPRVMADEMSDEDREWDDAVRDQEQGRSGPQDSILGKQMSEKISKMDTGPNLTMEQRSYTADWAKAPMSLFYGIGGQDEATKQRPGQSTEVTGELPEEGQAEGIESRPNQQNQQNKQGQQGQQGQQELDTDQVFTGRDLESRYGGEEPDIQFGGQRGFTASGDEGATDAQMMEAMGSPMSQEDIDSFNQMIRNQKISNRMEAGDYEGMGAAEFSEAVQSEGMPESSAPIVDAWQAAEEAQSGQFNAPSPAARDYRKMTGFDVPEGAGLEDKLAAVDAQEQYGQISPEEAEARREDISEGETSKSAAEAKTEAAEIGAEADIEAARQNKMGYLGRGQAMAQADIAEARAENQGGGGPFSGDWDFNEAENMMGALEEAKDALRLQMSSEDWAQLDEDEKNRRGVEYLRNTYRTMAGSQGGGQQGGDLPGDIKKQTDKQKSS